MAVSTVTVTIVGDNQSFTYGNMTGFFLTGTIAASPATYTTGGIPCNLAFPALVKAQRPPQYVLVLSTTGFIYSYSNGTTAANGTLKIYTAIGTELGNAATIPAGNSSDVLQIFATWLGQL